MAKFLGKSFVLQVGDVATPTNFQTVGAMRSTSLSINNEAIDVTDKDVMPWRELLEGGIRSLDATLEGIVSDSSTLATLRSAVMTGQIRHCKIVSALGDTWTGKFQIQTCERTGPHDKEETYSIKLASSGVITYTP